MRMKYAAVVVIAALAIMLAVGLRTASSADAAHGDCFSDGQGPSTPTICN